VVVSLWRGLGVGGVEERRSSLSQIEGELFPVCTASEDG